VDLYTASWIQFKSLYSLSLRSVLVLSSHLNLSVSCGLFSSCFLITILYAPLSCSCVLYAPSQPHFCAWTLQSIGWQDDYEWIGRNRSWPISRYYFSIFSGGTWKPCQLSVIIIANLEAENRTRVL